jgi:hypothetical protein
MNIPSERLNNLVRLGYTPEEARFLYIVATHSGYFTHRQFLEFSGTKPGKHSQKFLAKLLTEKHATYHTYQSGGRVYHVFSRTVFKAIDREDLRTRRRHELDYIQTRLITLDFVLSNLEHEYLETEAEKVPFFENIMKVNGDLLPAKVYASKISASRTTRYFVDRFPIFVRNSPSVSPLLTFTFVDPGSATLKAFCTHLQTYRALLRSIPQFEFIYVAPLDRFFKAAEAEFSRIVLGRFTGTSYQELFKYFRLRKAWESGERVAAAEVVFLNSARRQFSDKTVETLYQKWVQGAVNDQEVCASQAIATREISGTFWAQKCGDSLAVFSRPSKDLGERPAEIRWERLSRAFSPEAPQP